MSSYNGGLTRGVISIISPESMIIYNFGRKYVHLVMKFLKSFLERFYETFKKSFLATEF